MNILTRQNIFLRTNEIRENRQSIWFLHGFGDSGLAYREVFDALLPASFNLYVVDLPGFGVSPLQPDYPSIKEQARLLSEIIRQETQQQHQVNIVAHSLGSLIGTWVCQSLEQRINTYFSIEGNLTEADSYFSSKPLEFDTAEAFARSFEAEVFALAQTEERYKRYYSSLRYANPEGMRNWGFTSQEHVKDNQCGQEFINLNCNKIYLWGDLDTPIETQEFIKVNDLPNKLYKGIGHWHMVENPISLYADIAAIIKRNS